MSNESIPSDDRVVLDAEGNVKDETKIGASETGVDLASENEKREIGQFAEMTPLRGRSKFEKGIIPEDTLELIKEKLERSKGKGEVADKNLEDLQTAFAKPKVGKYPGYVAFNLFLLGVERSKQKFENAKSQKEKAKYKKEWEEFSKITRELANQIQGQDIRKTALYKKAKSKKAFEKDVIEKLRVKARKFAIEEKQKRISSIRPTELPSDNLPDSPAEPEQPVAEPTDPPVLESPEPEAATGSEAIEPAPETLNQNTDLESPDATIKEDSAALKPDENAKNLETNTAQDATTELKEKGYTIGQKVDYAFIRDDGREDFESGWSLKDIERRAEKEIVILESPFLEADKEFSVAEFLAMQQRAKELRSQQKNNEIQEQGYIDLDSPSSTEESEKDPKPSFRLDLPPVPTRSIGPLPQEYKGGEEDEVEAPEKDMNEIVGEFLEDFEQGKITYRLETKNPYGTTFKGREETHADGEQYYTHSVYSTAHGESLNKTKSLDDRFVLLCESSNAVPTANTLNVDVVMLLSPVKKIETKATQEKQIKSYLFGLIKREKIVDDEHEEISRATVKDLNFEGDGEDEELYQLSIEYDVDVLPSFVDKRGFLTSLNIEVKKSLAEKIISRVSEDPKSLWEFLGAIEPELVKFTLSPDVNTRKRITPKIAIYAEEDIGQIRDRMNPTNKINY